MNEKPNNVKKLCHVLSCEMKSDDMLYAVVSSDFLTRR